MKYILSLILFVGVACGASTNYFGWAPTQEFVYKYDSTVFTGIPGIRYQVSGIKLSAMIRIQSFPDYSLRLQVENPKFKTTNQITKAMDGEHLFETEEYEEMPEAIRIALISPFEAHFKKGVIEALFVEKGEPVVVSNIKKAILSQLQMDLTGSREDAVQKANHFVTPEADHQKPINTTSYTTMEETIFGDCETSYNIYPIPLWRLNEFSGYVISHKDRVHLPMKYQKSLNRKSDEISSDDFIESSKACAGKDYYEIIKAHNFNNCRQRPVFNTVSGFEMKCDAGKSGCESGYNAFASVRYIVCGTPEEHIVFRTRGKNIITLNYQEIKTEEVMKTTASMHLALVSITTSGFSEIQKPASPKQIDHLIMEYPEQKTFSPNSVSEKMPKSSQSDENQLTGFYPIHPMPTLEDAPKFLIPITISKSERLRQIRQIMTKIVTDIHKSPESCDFDVAGQIVAISKSMQHISASEMKEAYSDLLSYTKVYNKAALPVVKSLFLDIVSMVGTNPAVKVLRDLIEANEVSSSSAPQLLQVALQNVKTPTPELLNTMFEFIKSQKPKNVAAYSTGLVSLSDLLYRACVNPASMRAEFPVYIYGQFCNSLTPFVKETYANYLATELLSHAEQEKVGQEVLVIINALGKLGHLKSVKSLSVIIDGSKTKVPMVRSLAVYALKRSAALYPAIVKPILLSIYNHASEDPEVRIAALAVLPYAAPSLAELQNIAIRTWFEPSKQVASFAYTTLYSLSRIQSPSLTHLRVKAQKVLPHLKRVPAGIQFSHNIHSSKFVQHLQMVGNNHLIVVNSADSLVPSKISFTQNFVNRAIKVEGLTLSAYTQGMDLVLQKAMRIMNPENNMSEGVAAELQKIDEKLTIQKRKIVEPFAALKVGFKGMERLYTINSEMYSQTVQKVMEGIRSTPDLYTSGIPFNYVKAAKLSEVQTMAPTIFGFPIYIDATAPMVMSAKGFVQAKKPATESSTMPSQIRAYVNPIMNARVVTTMGVVSPFSKQYLGAGHSLMAHVSLPIDARVTLNQVGQIHLAVRAPEEIQKEVELFHFISKPFTFRKGLETIGPVNLSENVLTITSGKPMKKHLINPAKAMFGIDAPIRLAHNHDVLDVVSVLNKMRGSAGVLAALESVVIPQSIRFMSATIKFDPASSTAKEFETRFTLANALKTAVESPVKFNYPLKPLSYKTEVEKFCLEDKESDASQCISSQTAAVSSPSKVLSVDREICKAILRQAEESHMTEEQKTLAMTECLKYAQACQAAGVACNEKSGASKYCESKRRGCYVRLTNKVKVESLLERLSNGNALSVGMEASVNSHYETKTLSTYLTAGYTSTEDEVKGVFEFDIKAPGMEPYIVKTEFLSNLPPLKNRWDLDQMINEDVSLKTDAIIYYGRSSMPVNDMKRIVFQAIMTKTEAQAKTITNSQSYKICQEHIKQGFTLSKVCEKLRHEAASLDKLLIRLETPAGTPSAKVSTYGRYILESLFFPVAVEQTPEHEQLGTRKNSIVIEALVARHGQEAQLRYRSNYSQVDIYNVRMPWILKDVFPLSLRNNLAYRLLQKATFQQSPAACSVEPNYVRTFDNKTYEYGMNECEHLLVKDCSGSWPVAVTASGALDSKTIKIIAGSSMVIMNGPVKSVSLTVDGKKVEIVPGTPFRKYSPESHQIVLQAWAHSDGVLVVRDYYSGVEVAFDGQRVEVIAPQIIRSRACGVCGDMNGEHVGDVPTPKSCIYSKSSTAAVSYMMKDSCPGIPAQYKKEYELESKLCIKNDVVPVDIQNLLERLVQIKSGPSGIYRKHIVEYRANGNEVCISQDSVKICEADSLPIIGRMVTVPFTCFQSHSALAQQLKNKVQMGHEDVVGLAKFPTTYARMVEEARSCGAEPVSAPLA